MAKRVVITHAGDGAFQPCGWPGREGVDAKILWRRDANGPFTALVRYPTAWRRGVPEYMTVDEAVFAAAGNLIVNGSAFRDQTYGAFAPGAVRLASQAPEGATTLSFFSGSPQAIDGMAPNGLHEASSDVRRCGLYFDGWDADFDKISAPLWRQASARIKLLRRDAGGAETFIIGTLPIWRARQAERHDHDLEIFVIEGDLAWADASLGAWDHAFVPAGAAVGPYRSTDGATLLIRSHGPFRAEAC